jgi:putative ABC transport system substrate-binding protein
LQGGTREDGDKLSGEPFLSELVKFGYVEGKNLIVERRYADGRLDRLPALAAEIIAFRPDLIFAPPAPAAAAAKALTATVPIVFCFVNEPVALGLVQSVARPGGNLTGMSNFSVEIAGKRVELLKELVPGLTRLAIWYNPEAVNDAIECRRSSTPPRVLACSSWRSKLTSRPNMRPPLRPRAIGARMPFISTPTRQPSPTGARSWP